MSIFLECGCVVTDVDRSPKKCGLVNFVLCEVCVVVFVGAACHKFFQLFFVYRRILRVDCTVDVRAAYEGLRLIDYGLFRKVGLQEEI